MDLNKTLGILGTSHEESIAKFNPTKTRPKGGIKEIPPRALPTQELKKPQNRAPLLTDLGGTQEFPPSNPQEKGPENNPKKSPREGSENHHQEQPGETPPNLEEPRRIIYT
jgi:hypothetical protein